MVGPQEYQQAVGITTLGANLVALRSDGAVFVLFRRNDIGPEQRVVEEPMWVKCPPVPGTIAHAESIG